MKTANFRPEYISFDCYGTLINYQTEAATRPLLADRVPEELMAAFMRDWRHFRYDQVCGDYYPYEQVLQDAWDRVCQKWNLTGTEDAGKQFGAAVRSWGAHDGVIEPLKRMGESYKLVILSNADDSFLQTSVPRLEAPFHAVYTAEQAGFYKPRYGAFEYMLEQLDASPEDFVHVSSHTRYDLMPAHDLGFSNLVMLDRGYDPHSPAYNYSTVASLNELNKLLGL
ncbi:HAD hydrolase-like protein [Arthrobacter sp. ISL-48]|uniref:HAD family hydrolase n=1 Tax=Arthrobacter sp. ISL-48 TaxID=2819110 RepID=UPI001BE6E485|nr:HAD family hydrolase [Arthrobacter sp. ISL-48]MBT2533048.1 HAD hydrolase-like protein [Arthrobacter sp. ISL-48]